MTTTVHKTADTIREMNRRNNAFWDARTDPASIEQAKRQMERYSSLQMAREMAAQGDKIMMILKGDDGRYWVGLPVYTERLNAVGYQYIR